MTFIMPVNKKVERKNKIIEKKSYTLQTVGMGGMNPVIWVDRIQEYFRKSTTFFFFFFLQNFSHLISQNKNNNHMFGKVKF